MAQKEKDSMAHCRSCGKDVAENAVACPSCGVKPNDGKLFCQNCGKETNEKAMLLSPLHFLYGLHWRGINLLT